MPADQSDESLPQASEPVWKTGLGRFKIVVFQDGASAIETPAPPSPLPGPLPSSPGKRPGRLKMFRTWLSFAPILAWEQLRRGGPAAVVLALLLSALFLFRASGALLDTFPYALTATADGSRLTVSFDGKTSTVPLDRRVADVQFTPIESWEREYQIDGSDLTNTGTLDRDYFAAFSRTPYYRFQAWLRDEGSYSQWRDLRISDSAGRTVATAGIVDASKAVPVPENFTLKVSLRRMEINRAVHLGLAGGGFVALVPNRNEKYFRIAESLPDQPEKELAKQFFPEQVGPPIAIVLYSVLRGCGFAVILALLALGIGWLVPKRMLMAWPRLPRRLPLAGVLVVLAGVCIWVARWLYGGVPHIGDAVSYYLQARTFASGRLTVPVPPVGDSFWLPFTVIHNNQWFSMYTPGAGVAFALGLKLHAAWLVGPALAVGAAAITYLIGRRQFGPRVALLAAGLMATSPFLALQSGSFLSHTPAMFADTVLVYAAVRYLETPNFKWAAVGATALGYAFLVREMSGILYGVTVSGFVLIQSLRARRFAWLKHVLIGLAIVAVFCVAYLLYNKALTGSATLLPRTLNSVRDNKWGFGDGIGFFNRHTPASGVVNADEMLTSLQIMLFGWPFFLTFAVLSLPFVLRRFKSWDVLHLAIFGAFVSAYVGLYYHGIIIGPRYYVDAIPVLALLSAHGIAALAGFGRDLWTRWGRTDAGQRGIASALGLVGALVACNAVYFWPRQIPIYRHLWSIDAPFLVDGSSQPTGLKTPAIIGTSDQHFYFDWLGALNCPLLNCPVEYAWVPDGPTGTRLRTAVHDRTWYKIVGDDAKHYTLEPDTAPAIPPEATLPAESVLLRVPFDSSGTSVRGPQPAEGTFLAAQNGQGALLSGQGHFVYQPVPIDPQHGTIAISVQPRWTGTDGQGYVIVEAGSQASHIRLSKDPAANLRFQVWDGKTESNIGYGVGDWKPGELHRLVAIWDAGKMQLQVDGFPVGNAELHSPAQLLPAFRVGINEDRNASCECVVRDLVVGKAALPFKTGTG